MKYDAIKYTLTEKGNLGTISLVIGILGLLAGAYGYTQDHYRFYNFYMVAFLFWLYVALGGLFFTLLHHITGASWSVVLRRLSEAMMMNLPFMIIFFIPIIFGMHDLFHWTHADAVAADPILLKKAPYLNVTFFYIRVAFYFIVWTFFSLSFYRMSKNQDATPGLDLTKKARRLSAPGMILFALTITFASFDWLMSLDPHWFSTIFGVYTFSGAFLAFLTVVIPVVIYQRKHDILTGVVTTEHLHDLGKFTFAFIIFWSYMAFSQYFLIWYANIPEETYWFLKRWEGPWKAVSLLIIFGHFAFPFLALLTRASKRHAGWLIFMSAWILLMRFTDLFWLVVPNMKAAGGDFNGTDIITIVGTMLGIGGLFFWMFWRRYTSGPLVPLNDPNLQKSIEFINN